MSRFRRVLAWIVLLLLPLQASSAVSMRACGAGMNVPASLNADTLDHSASARVHGSGATYTAGHSDSPLPRPAVIPNDRALTDLYCGAYASACCFTHAVAEVQGTEAIHASADAPQTVLAHLRTRAEAPPKKPPRL